MDGIYVDDGRLEIRPYETITFPAAYISYILKASNFVLKYQFSDPLEDYDVLVGGRGDAYLVDLGVRFRSSEDQKSYYEFFTSVGARYRLTLVDDTAGTSKILSSDRVFVRTGVGTNFVSIIAIEDEIAIFLNSKLITSVTDNTLFGDGNYFWAAGGNPTISIDNVQFWNLDGVEF